MDSDSHNVHSQEGRQHHETRTEALGIELGLSLPSVNGSEPHDTQESQQDARSGPHNDKEQKEETGKATSHATVVATGSSNSGSNAFDNNHSAAEQGNSSLNAILMKHNDALPNLLDLTTGNLTALPSDQQRASYTSLALPQNVKEPPIAASPQLPSEPAPSPVIESAANSSTSTGHKPNLFKSIPSQRTTPMVATPPLLYATSNNPTNNTVKVFQRMDELSVRMIAMEEMLERLCNAIDRQDQTIKQMQSNSNSWHKELESKINKTLHRFEASAKQAITEQHTFATDLLNSITTVSNSYLRKIKSRPVPEVNCDSFPEIPTAPRSKYNATAMARTNNSVKVNTSKYNYNNSNNNNSHNNWQLPQKTSFTLNPNGIKRRSKKYFNVNKTSFNNPTSLGANRNQASENGNTNVNFDKDLHSMNNFSTISLPNLSLESTGITPYMKSNTGQAFNFTQNETAPTVGANKPITFEQGSFSEASDTNISDDDSRHEDTNEEEVEDEDGYQEDDDEDNEDYGTTYHDEDDDTGGSIDEEDEVDDEEDGKTGEDKKRKHHTGKKKKKKLPTPVSKPASKDETSSGNGKEKTTTADSQTSPPIKYTISKAPSSVRAIWEEYVNGIDGKPSIKSLEERYGNKWRVKKNKKTFARRKRLYKYILNGIQKGKTANEMIRSLEDRRLYKDEKGVVKRRTIGWLQQSLSGI